MPRMGESAFLGVAVRDVQHKFRIEIGPLSAEEYNRFLRVKRGSPSCATGCVSTLG